MNNFTYVRGERGSLRASLRAALGITSTSGGGRRDLSEDVARQIADSVAAELEAEMKK